MLSKNKLLFYGGLILIFIYLSPYYILGESSRVRIHDNLDSNIVWYKLMADTHTLFAGPKSVIPNIMNGLPRNSLGSEFDLYILMFSIVSPFTAYVINQTILRLVAYIGMYWLLRNHVIKEKNQLEIITGVSLAFALLPYWPSMGLSIAGLPLALNCFINIKNGYQKKRDWFILCLLPFYSSFILSFSFFIGCLGIWWFIESIVKRKVNWGWFWALSVMTVLYLFVNYRIIDEMFLQQDFIPHRESFSRGHLEGKEIFWRAVSYFTMGQTHVERFTEFIVFPIVIFSLLAAFFKKQSVRLILLLFVLNFVFSYAIAFYYSKTLWSFSDKFELLTSFNFGRIHFLEPLLWYISFALGLSFIYKYFKKGKAFAYILLALQILLLLSFNEETKYTYYNFPTYKQYFSTSLFSEIKNYIGKDPSSYRVVSIGMHPSIAQYNGFYTLDGYVVSYPLSYKKEFRKIIAPELKKNASLRHYYDNWGSRCYIFVDELGKHYRYTKDKHKVVKHLDLNTKALAEMGGQYILSAVRIEHPEKSSLLFEKAFDNQQSPWKIYLYRVKL